MALALHAYRVPDEGVEPFGIGRIVQICYKPGVSVALPDAARSEKVPPLAMGVG